MEAEYLNAAFPQRVIILGQSLEPFALGHLRFLLHLQNAFVTSAKPDLMDLLQGVFVCAQKATDAVETYWNGTTEKRLFGSRRLMFTDYIKAWRKSIGMFDVAETSQNFAQYITNGSTWPKMHNPDEEGRMPGAPFIQRVLLVLEGRLGHTHSEALNKPWGEAMHDYYAYWEIEGSAKILNEDDLEHLRAVRELEAEAAKAMEVQPC